MSVTIRLIRSPGEGLQVVEGLDPQVPDDAVGDLVVDVAHDPLGQGRDGDGDHDSRNHGQQGGEVHLPRPRDGVYPPARQYGDIEGQPHRQEGQHQGEGHQAAIGADIAKNAPQGPGVAPCFPLV